MNIGIIGARWLGHAMARVATHAGRSVVIASSRGPESLTTVVSALGDEVSAATAGEAASAATKVATSRSQVAAVTARCFRQRGSADAATPCRVMSTTSATNRSLRGAWPCSSRW